MNLELLRAQLYAMSAQIQALIVGVEQALELARAAAPASGACPHPEDRRRAMGNFAQPKKFLCLDCNTEVDGA